MTTDPSSPVSFFRRAFSAYSQNRPHGKAPSAFPASQLFTMSGAGSVRKTKNLSGAFLIRRRRYSPSRKTNHAYHHRQWFQRERHARTPAMAQGTASGPTVRCGVGFPSNMVASGRRKPGIARLKRINVTTLTKRVSRPRASVKARTGVRSGFRSTSIQCGNRDTAKYAAEPTCAKGMDGEPMQFRLRPCGSLAGNAW